MNYSICLDPSSFDLTSLSANGFSVYTDLDNFTTPIIQNIPSSLLFPPPIGTCPFTLSGIPNGATQLLIIDQCEGEGTGTKSSIPPPADPAPTTNCCYALIDIETTPPVTSSFCTTCSLDFDVFSSSYIGQIVAGNLTSTCGPITDYTIGWYLNGDYSAPEFISGTGSAFIPYQFSHPLTGNYSVPALAGNWEGIIHDISINGVVYSSVSGSANGILIPFESCFDTVVVEPLGCDNGPYSGSAKYSHQINFNSQAIGTTSAPVSLTYALSPSTKYFAYGFQAFNVWDEIEIKWVSGNPSVTSNPTLYSQPIYLEKIKVGSDIPSANLPSQLNTNINNVWPKQANLWGQLNRVLTLTNLETSSNPSSPDLLEITITPNPNNNNTQWKAGFQCLDDFDCTDCAFDNYPDSLPKIAQIELNKQYSCDAQQIILSISGCYSPNSDWMGYPENPFNSLSGSLISSYNPWFTNPANPGIIKYYFPGGAQYNQYVALKPSVSCTTWGQYTILCGSSSTGSITLNKTPGQIQLTFNTEGDYLHYKNNLISAYQYLSTVGGTNITSSIPCPAGSTDVSYYRAFYLTVPIQPNPSANCGDNTVPFVTRFHINDYFNVIYVENPSINTWSITIPQTPIINCYPQNSCDTCYLTINNWVNAYNGVANDPTIQNFTTTVGAKYFTPFGGGSGITRNISSSPSGSVCVPQIAISQWYSEYSIKTIPFVPSPQSPTGWVNLPTLAASLPCNTTPYLIAQDMPGLQLNYVGYIGAWQVRFPNLTSSFDYSLSTNDFEIYSLTGFGSTGSLNQTQNVYPIPCPDPTGSLIYSYIGGVATVHTSSYFTGGNPILVIDP